MEPLTHDLLSKLQAAGYNVLESDRLLPDENAILTPRTVENLDEYIDMLDDSHLKELFIDECLGWREEDLQGLVKLDEPS